MKYAKCIKPSQIAKDVDDFNNRKDEEHHVYCKGQITKTKHGDELLYCVPLNFIFDCLKYGLYLAVIEVDDDSLGYPNKGSYLGLHKATSEQYVIDIMNVCEKETIDFVFEEVGNPDLVHDGYVHFLPEELQEYFRMKKQR